MPRESFKTNCNCEDCFGNGARADEDKDDCAAEEDSDEDESDNETEDEDDKGVRKSLRQGLETLKQKMKSLLKK